VAPEFGAAASASGDFAGPQADLPVQGVASFAGGGIGHFVHRGSWGMTGTGYYLRRAANRCDGPPDRMVRPACHEKIPLGGHERPWTMAIRVGIGGWNYAPWREHFYPRDLAQRLELEYASRQVTAIEINATYYRTQSAASFARWREETPDGFVFSLKASRYATNRRVLAEAGDSIKRFVESGIAELGDKLGPVVWQFAPTKRFDPDDLDAFLAQLPSSHAGLPLRHVLEVRHESFLCGEFVALAARHRAATVYTDSSKFPSLADRTGDVVYARLMNADLRFKNGYAPAALDDWAKHARDWSKGRAPADLPCLTAAGPSKVQPPHDVFVFFINGAKERAPAAAMALLERLQGR
jgi:uncharacterized protein YecE (DUF72 family)